MSCLTRLKYSRLTLGGTFYTEVWMSLTSGQHSLKNERKYQAQPLADHFV
jgi:hypothetical protein